MQTSCASFSVHRQMNQMCSVGKICTNALRTGGVRNFRKGAKCCKHFQHLCCGSLARRVANHESASPPLVRQVGELPAVTIFIPRVSQNNLIPLIILIFLSFINCLKCPKIIEILSSYYLHCPLATPKT